MLENASGTALLYHDFLPTSTHGTSISPLPRLVYIPLNMSICKKTFPHACRSCERSVSKSECFTCLKKRWRSAVPRLVYIPLNRSLCMRTFTHACRACESSIEYFTYKRVFHLPEKASRPPLIYHDFLPTSTHEHKYITCS